MTDEIGPVRRRVLAGLRIGPGPTLEAIARGDWARAAAGILRAGRGRGRGDRRAWLKLADMMRTGKT